MQNAKRRFSDRAAGTAVSSLHVSSHEDPAAKRWIDDCASRMIDVEPDLTREEALEIARSVREFERTGAMQPDAAARFLASEMRTPSHSRFERRGASVARAATGTGASIDEPGKAQHDAS
jgi:hypothetical protein